jgi:hypothetical protein
MTETGYCLTEYVQRIYILRTHSIILWFVFNGISSMSAGRRYFSVESWLRKANVDESAECATVGPAASVGNAVNPAIDMKDSNTVEEVSIG